MRGSLGVAAQLVSARALPDLTINDRRFHEARRRVAEKLKNDPAFRERVQLRHRLRHQKVSLPKVSFLDASTEL